MSRERRGCLVEGRVLGDGEVVEEAEAPQPREVPCAGEEGRGVEADRQQHKAHLRADKSNQIKSNSELVGRIEIWWIKKLLMETVRISAGQG